MGAAKHASNSTLTSSPNIGSLGITTHSVVIDNTVYEQLAKIDRVLEILEDNKPNGVIDNNVDSVDKISLPESVDSISPDNQLVEVANSNVHSVEEINGDNKPNGVVDENSIESLNLKRNTYTVLKDAQVNTIEDLNKYGVTGLRTLKNLGNKSVSQIVEALQSRGIELAELPDPEHTPSL
ncbi:DNA-directed RNA polymerase subunit alpha C-terminal domain-containing protein [Nostoc sp. LEGE 06077]|uniref:DNA-directed RNA polymerase subunit alpha C-terminal domain-containing protein n=1 Tax=Nostoc sp. LEGE 06077 TaxID=915325 RepID=UPI002AD3DE5A|nr:DNA-directed RNA polymerase subunit alpha C-terminal domain-containing protein [Nostoc sp. LEGE 06077]